MKIGRTVCRMARGKDDSGEELNLQDVLGLLKCIHSSWAYILISLVDAISSTKIKKRIEGIKSTSGHIIPRVS